MRIGSVFFDVNVLSDVRLVLPEMIHYGMTRAAQLTVARGLAESLAGTSITVNSVLPGPTNSRGVGDFVEGLAQSGCKTFEQVEAEFLDHIRLMSLIKRFASPQEVASLVTYVASPLASATTGAALRADGAVIKRVFRGRSSLSVGPLCKQGLMCKALSVVLEAFDDRSTWHYFCSSWVRQR